jgi:hypothetical protein
MSTFVRGIIPKDDKYNKMLRVYEACEEAETEQPIEVIEFFRLNDFDEPDPNGIVIDLDDIATDWQSDGCLGVEIAIDKLPKDVKIIRFINSW